MDIVKKRNDNAWGVDCCRELMQTLHLKLTDIPTLQPAIFLAMDNSVHLKRGLEDDKPKPTEEQTKAARVIAEMEANQKKGDHGLDMFALNPRGMKGIELFNH